MTNAADTHRANANAAANAAAESFDRCDTDGFVSQHSHMLRARLERARAIITDDGGRAVFVGLYDGDRRVAARIIDTKYGDAWLLDDAEADRYGRRFVPTGERSRVQRELGLAERDEWDTAGADYAAPAGARGFSGLGQVYIETFRTGDRWGADAVLVEEEEGTP